MQRLRSRSIYRCLERPVRVQLVDRQRDAMHTLALEERKGMREEAAEKDVAEFVLPVDLACIEQAA